MQVNAGRPHSEPRGGGFGLQRLLPAPTRSEAEVSVESSGCHSGMPRWIRSARMSSFCLEPAGAAGGRELGRRLRLEVFVVTVQLDDFKNVANPGHRNDTTPTGNGRFHPLARGHSADSGEMGGGGNRGGIERQIGGAREQGNERQVDQQVVNSKPKLGDRAGLAAMAIGPRTLQHQNTVANPVDLAGSTPGIDRNNRPRSDRVFCCGKGPGQTNVVIMERRSHESNNSSRTFRFFQPPRDFADETHGLR